MLKAFQRTVEEARFTFVIVDANNLRFEDFKTYWSAGQVLTLLRNADDPFRFSTLSFSRRLLCPDSVCHASESIYLLLAHLQGGILL